MLAWQAEKNYVRRPPTVFISVGRFCASRFTLGILGGIHVLNRDFVPTFHQIDRHGLSHRAKTHKAYFHLKHPFYFMPAAKAAAGKLNNCKVQRLSMPS